MAWGIPTSQYSPLTINSVTRNLSVDGHTHNYLPLSGGNLTGALTINSNTVWHAGNDGAGSGLDADLLRGVAPSNLAVASATKLANTITIWGQNFNGEGNVSGALSGATTGSFSSTISATTGIFSNLTANYIPKHTAGGLANSLIYDNGTNVGIGRADAAYKLDVNGAFRAVGTAYFGNNLRIQDSGSYSELIGGVGKSIKFYTNDGVYNPLNLFSSGNVGVNTGTDAGYKLDVNGTFRTTGAVYLNSTLAVTGTSTLTGLLTANGGVIAANVISNGAVVAGALNGTLPDDLPVATTSLFGVIKTGLSLNNNVGVVNINGRHYTTTSAYTDAACRTISAEIPIGAGTIANGETISIQLTGFLV